MARLCCPGLCYGAVMWSTGWIRFVVSVWRKDETGEMRHLRQTPQPYPTEIPRAPPSNPTVGLCLGSLVGPWGGGGVFLWARYPCTLLQKLDVGFFSALGRKAPEHNVFSKVTLAPCIPHSGLLTDFANAILQMRYMHVGG